MSRTWKSKMYCVLALLTMTAGTLQAAVVNAPYSNDFSVGAADFTTAGGNWAVSGGAYVSTSTSGNQASTALVEVANLGAANTTDFTVSATLTPGTDWQTSGASVHSQTMGFAALADAGLTHYYLADVNGDETLRILEVGGSGLLNSTTAMTIAAGTTYTLTLSGTYEVDGLHLSLTIADGVNADVTVNAIDATVSTGQFFGFRHRSDSDSAGLVIAADDFSINAATTTIPTPAALPAGLGLLGLLLVRRR